MTSIISIRFFLILLFFSSTFFFPWFVTTLLALALLAVSSGYEVVFGGLMLDFLYGTDVPSYIGSPFLFTIFFAILFVAGFYIKKHLIFYNFHP